MITVLHTKLRPTRHLLRTNVFEQKNLLTMSKDILDVLQPSILKGRHEVTHYIKQVN